MKRVITLVAVLALAFFGCDDAASGGGSGDGGPGGEGGEGGEGGTAGMGGTAGQGGEGGEGGGAPIKCITDEECPDAQYCDVPEGALEGECRIGCRQGGCPDDQICNLQTRECEAGPCETDDQCAEGTYCNNGSCDDGCRTDPDSCGAGVCNEDTRECEALRPCCGGDGGDECSLATEAACEGTSITNENIVSCDSNPCGPMCEADDDCPEGQWCNTDDGLCADGCRTDPDTCPEGQTCDPDKHTCEDNPCESDEECRGPDGGFCEEGVCRPGCRDDDDCPDGVCNDMGVCIDGGDACDPNDAEACPDGYCDPILEICRELCGENDDCNDGEFCDPENNQCVPGCRDDALEAERFGPDDEDPPVFGNDDIDHAAPIALEEVVVGDRDLRIGSVEGSRICGDDPDFYSVQLNEGDRLRVELSYEGQGNLDLRLHGEAIEDGPLEEAGLEVPEVIVFPPLGQVVPPTTYIIEVFGNVEGIAGLDYQLRVTVVDARDACFPDDREFDGGDNSPETATRSPDPGAFDGTLCVGDTDWYVFQMGINAGLMLEAVATAGGPADDDQAMQIDLYSASRLNQPGGLGNPNFSIEDANDIPEGIQYLFDEAENQGIFSDEDWYVRLRPPGPEAFVEYRLSIDPIIVDDMCGNDGGTEPNDDIVNAVDVDEVANGGATLPDEAEVEVDIDLEICPRDEDFFCMTAEDNDILEAWIVSDDVAGQLVIQFFDPMGQQTGRQGAHTGGDDEPDPARVAGASEGTWCFQVDGLQAAQGSYDLFVRRTPTEGECGGLDFPEQQRRNDDPATATPLPDVSGGEGLRFAFEDGVVCDPGNPDVDWYSFPVGEERSRVCVVIDGFEDATGDLELGLYREGDRSDDVCPCNNPDFACIGGRCTPPVRVSTSDLNNELVDLNKDIVGANTGAQLLRVSRSDGDEPQGYRITATVVPEPAAGDPCPADWQEIGDRNDDPADATFLGGGQFAACDTWVCEDERIAGDWFEITVPEGEDRTVIVSYANEADGRIFLSALREELPGDGPFDSSQISQELRGNHQCINFRGGMVDRNTQVGVEADLFRNDTDDPDRDNGDGRIDFSIRVVPTDLDENPAGECNRLGAIDLPACEDGGPLECWPTLSMEPPM